MKLQGRKLSRAFFILLLFFVFGVSFYTVQEELAVHDAFYFIILTITTVGYGDVFPKTELGKILTCFYVFAGLALLAEALNIVQDYFIERINRMSRKLARETAIAEKEAAQEISRKDKDEMAENALKTVLKSKTEEDDAMKKKHTGTFETLVSGMVGIGRAKKNTAVVNRRLSLTKQVTLSRLHGKEGGGGIIPRHPTEKSVTHLSASCTLISKMLREGGGRGDEGKLCRLFGETPDRDE